MVRTEPKRLERKYREADAFYPVSLLFNLNPAAYPPLSLPPSLAKKKIGYENDNDDEQHAVAD